MPFGNGVIMQVGGSVVLPNRKKSEVLWTGLTGVTLVGDTEYDLISVLKALPAPNSGTLTPFFNTTSDKLNVYNDNSSVAFKLNLQGNWSSGSVNRSIQLDFIGTNGNRLVASRDVAVTTDVITLATFFSIDKNGFIATQGTKPVIRSNGGTFNVTGILIIAEQVTKETAISPV